MIYQNHFQHLRDGVNDAVDIFNTTAEEVERKEKPVDKDHVKALFEKAKNRVVKIKETPAIKAGEQINLF